MLHFSPKGTVPVLVTAEKVVIDESLDIMYWALKQSDPDQWLPEQDSPQRQEMQTWIACNDGPFKQLLDQYKYPNRFPELSSEIVLQTACEIYLHPLNQRLEKNQFLQGKNLSMLDIALFPFVRQWMMVDENRFQQLDLKLLSAWLNFLIMSDLFNKAMAKYPVWRDTTT
jgi:glutathione S-transferase